MSSQDIVGREFRSEVLNREIRAHFLTSEELAVMVGVTTKSIDRWRRGEAEPRLKSIRTLAQVLGREPADFYEEVAA